jgi:hypothetical protein
MFNFINFLIMANISMAAAEPYLYFRGVADEDLCVQASKLTSVHATSGTNIRLTFTGNDYAYSLFDRKDANKETAGEWKNLRHVYVNLTHSGGANFEKSFMKKLVQAINTPVAIGDSRSTYNGGFIVVYDSVETGANFAGISAAAVTTDG